MNKTLYFPLLRYFLYFGNRREPPRPAFARQLLMWKCSVQWWCVSSFWTSAPCHVGPWGREGSPFERKRGRDWMAERQRAYSQCHTPNCALRRNPILTAMTSFFPPLIWNGPTSLFRPYLASYHDKTHIALGFQIFCIFIRLLPIS